MKLTDLLTPPAAPCACGKIHNAGLSRVLIEHGAIHALPEIIRSYAAEKVFLLADENTWEAAGRAVSDILTAADIPHTVYVLPGKDRIEPDERPVGSVAMHFDHSCDLVLGVGSGVVNDIGKIIANLTGRQYVIFGTAPSMDGYASATSSMVRDGLKYSLPSRCPDTIVGDLDILCAAPMELLLSGLGDMLAKYVSLAEWKISNIINGEYYCPIVAAQVQEALDLCMANLEGLSKREPAAVRAVMEGMILSGVAMTMAGVSRPASGMEHYISHIADMRGVEFGLPTALHGIQCGAATVESLAIYEKLRTVTPDREKALTHAKSFSYEDWKAVLRQRLGNGAKAMIAAEAKEGKYSTVAHERRLEVILSRWEELQAVIHSLPLPAEIIPALDAIGFPTSLAAIGWSDEDRDLAVLMSRDIRDKYVGSRLLWDLGI